MWAFRMICACYFVLLSLLLCRGAVSPVRLRSQWDKFIPISTRIKIQHTNDTLHATHNRYDTPPLPSACVVMKPSVQALKHTYATLAKPVDPNEPLADAQPVPIITYAAQPIQPSPYYQPQLHESHGYPPATGDGAYYSSYPPSTSDPYNNHAAAAYYQQQQAAAAAAWQQQQMWQQQQQQYQQQQQHAQDGYYPPSHPSYPQSDPYNSYPPSSAAYPYPDSSEYHHPPPSGAAYHAAAPIPGAGRRAPRSSGPSTSTKAKKAPSSSSTLESTTNNVANGSRRPRPTNLGPHSPQAVRGPTRTSAPTPLMKGSGIGAGQAAADKLAAAASSSTATQKPITYKPHTLAEFRDLTLDIKLGGLGPDLDNSARKEKEAHLQRIKLLGERIREENLNKQAEIDARAVGGAGGQRTKKEATQVKEPTALERAKEFAERIPKPRPRRAVSDGDEIQLVPQRIAGSSASTLVPRHTSPERRARGLDTNKSQPSNGGVVKKKSTAASSTSNAPNPSSSSTSPSHPDSDRALQELLQKQASQRAKVEQMKAQMGV